MSQVSITNLSFRTTPDDLYRAFSPFGELTECRLVINERQESKGYGFISYKSSYCASQAIAAMNGFKMDGCNIVVSLSHSRKGEKNTNPNQLDDAPRDGDSRPMYNRRN
ncbi:hypothetical protein TVAG_050410 [Trichomonas vaginalis G3]|uniref:RRM domain-containing protein n=1 Tax=Trichomonas vaginalis (strain ATCC PRA-98 / G3) TaxID=412133 RepID=A2EJG8_TRIV3|nr:RNA-binding domain, RBD family-containing protein [Trichomonas vaginalis G3]EAY07225.1 hypothetical protein TVAG_050410 [Trichomonas vaginalis G3]KAI5533913.1 RNA-binding domain, RBD family-containing protein [Trichomonas vaginalis G3]|eukprot:XP_001319448.1 hypothetical protein [Trichomonas vaginalis G3]